MKDKEIIKRLMKALDIIYMANSLSLDGKYTDITITNEQHLEISRIYEYALKNNKATLSVEGGSDETY